MAQSIELTTPGGRVVGSLPAAVALSSWVDVSII